jgi:hypothetical protein
VRLGQLTAFAADQQDIDANDSSPTSTSSQTVYAVPNSWSNNRASSGCHHLHVLPGRSDGAGCFEDGFLRDKSHVLVDRDGKFCEAFRSILEQSGVAPVRLPAHSPNRNASD